MLAAERKTITQKDFENRFKGDFMRVFMRYPEGKAKALTLSYDDGYVEDIRLIETLKPYGIKATFNINSGMFSDEDAVSNKRMSKKQAKETYTNSGHEIASHALTHAFLDKLPLHLAINEVLEDRKNLEEMFGCVVRGFAYPYGDYNDEVVDMLKGVGIAYARTVNSTCRFSLPEDWLRLTPTCHHKLSRLSELADEFLADNPNADKARRAPMLFYMWGHSYEFCRENNWEILEDFAKKMGNREDIWYATNIELYNYVAAYNSLKFSADASFVFNPSALTVWFEKNGTLHQVHANETIRI